MYIVYMQYCVACPGSIEKGYKSVVCTMERPSCLVGSMQLSSPTPNPSTGRGSPAYTENSIVVKKKF